MAGIRRTATAAGVAATGADDMGNWNLDVASTTETVRAYMAALSDHDVDAAVALWEPGGTDRISGEPALVAPEGIRGYFDNLFSAFPDWRFTVIDTTAQGERCVVHWSTRATFAGPGRLQGISANGESIAIQGMDSMTVANGRIVDNVAVVDRADVLIQLGVLPAPGTRAERGMTLATNLRHGIGRRLAAGSPQLIAPGVWLLKAYAPGAMNVYFIAEPDGGVTVFDAGIAFMRRAIAATAAQLGGLRRIVLGHADCDHRGGAAGQSAEILCHPLEVEAATAAAHSRPYWDPQQLKPTSRPLYPRLLRFWDGGALEVTGTLTEGDEISDFEVIELPGHAPGLIGLIREEDGLVLCSDMLYTLDAETGLPGRPRVPHPAFNADIAEARASIEKLADRDPKVVWPGHSHPVSGPDLAGQLRRVAQS